MWIESLNMKVVRNVTTYDFCQYTKYDDGLDDRAHNTLEKKTAGIFYQRHLET